MEEAPQVSSRLCQQSPDDLLSHLLGRCRRKEGPRFLCVGRSLGEGRGYRNETISWIDDVGLKIPEWANFLVPNLANARSGRKGVEPQQGHVPVPPLPRPGKRLGAWNGGYTGGANTVHGEGFEAASCVGRGFGRGGEGLHSWWDVCRLSEDYVLRFLTEMKGLFDEAAKTQNSCSGCRMSTGMKMAEGKDRNRKRYSSTARLSWRSDRNNLPISREAGVEVIEGLVLGWRFVAFVAAVAKLLGK